MIQDGTMWIASCGPVFNEYSHDGAMADPKEGVLGLPPPPLLQNFAKKGKNDAFGGWTKINGRTLFLNFLDPLLWYWFNFLNAHNSL